MKSSKQTKSTWFAIIPGILTPICCQFPYGFGIGTINSAADVMKPFYNQSHFERYGVPLDEQAIETLWVLTASLFPIGGICGSFFVKQFLRRFGRKYSLIYIQGLVMIGSILMSTAYLSKSYESVIVGRAIMGIYCSLVIGIGPLYVSEIVPAHLRAPIGSLFSVSIGLGILFGNILGFQQILGTPTGWPFLLASNVVPSLIFLSYSWRMPQSPRALYFDFNQPDKARKVLQRLIGNDDVTEQMEVMRNEAQSMAKQKIMSVKEVLTSRRVRWQLISCIVLAMAFQFTGINGIFFYLNTILAVAGIPYEIMDYVTIGFVAMEMFGALSGLLSNKLGRKTMLIFGNVVAITSMIIYTVATALQPSANWLSYVSVVGGVGIIFGFSIGPGPITLVILPEMLDQSARPTVMMTSGLTLWMGFTIVSVTTPYLFDYLKFAAFLPFAAILAFSVFYIWFVVPETKGKSVLAIQMHFAKWNKVPIASIMNGQENIGDSDVTKSTSFVTNGRHPAVSNPSFLNDFDGDTLTKL